MNLSARGLFNRPMLSVFVACLGGLIGWSAASADEVDLVVGSEPPYRLRVSLLAEDASWTEHFDKVQDRYLELLFDRLDADHDGKLTQPEAKRTPAPVFSMEETQTGNINETHVAFNFLVLDDDGDGFVNRRELKAYYADYTRGSIVFGTWNIPGASDGRSTPLFQHLDQNQDGFLNAEEVAGMEKLWNFDRNADELLSQNELQPSTVAVSDTGEFVATTTTTPVRIVRNYEVKPVRVDGDTQAANLRLTYRPSRGKSSQFELQNPKANEGVDVKNNRVVIRQGDFQLEFVVRPPSLRVLEQTRDVLRREVASLPGEKKITDDETFPVFLRDHAALVDANADGQLTDAELESYLVELLPARLAAESVRVMFRSSRASAGLFAYLDQDQDGQLSQQELSRLAKFPRGNGCECRSKTVSGRNPANRPHSDGARNRPAAVFDRRATKRRTALVLSSGPKPGSDLVPGGVPRSSRTVRAA